jgi:general secretion pathway protein D
MQCVRKLSILLCLLTVLVGCAAGRTAFDKGEKFESAGNLDQAVLKYAEAATANPEIKEYRLRFLMVSEQASRLHSERADNFLAEKKYDDALREYQTAFTLDQSQARAKQQMTIVAKLRSSQAFFKEGEELEKGHKNREALRSYQKALEFNSASKEAKEGIERMLKTTKPKLDGYELNLKS